MFIFTSVVLFFVIGCTPQPLSPLPSFDLTSYSSVLVVDDQKHHLGDGTYKKGAGGGVWDNVLIPESISFTMSFRLDSVRDGTVLLVRAYSSELSTNTVSVNGKEVGALCLTGEFSWKICTLALSPDMLRVGENKLTLTASQNRPDNYDDLLVYGIRIGFS